MISALVMLACPMIEQARSQRCGRCSTPVNFPIVVSAPTMQNFPGPQPMSKTRVPGSRTRNAAARRAMIAGVQCTHDFAETSDRLGGNRKTIHVRILSYQAEVA